MKKRRKFYRGVVNHIYQKAVHGFNLFYCDEDRIVFYTIFSVAARSAPDVKALGLCLMYDHFHSLLLFEKMTEMSAFMDHCTSWYAKEYNEHVGRKGRLFRKNYGSAPKWGLKKIHSAISYLFNNPVEKHLCDKAELFRWSFLPYLRTKHPFSEPVVLKNASTAFRQARKEVDNMVELNIPLNYPQLRRMRRNLTACEWEQLVDHLIVKYWPFDNAMLLSFYDSYEEMLIAINSNTGGEYDLKEDFLPFTDLPYGEMIDYLAGRMDPIDVRKVTMRSSEEKMTILEELRKYTTADMKQIHKFLHMIEGVK